MGSRDFATRDSQHLRFEKLARFWDAKTLANQLGVPVSWIYDRTRRNGPETIPHLKLGKYIRFNPRSDVFQEWLKAREKGSTVGSATQRRLQVVENKE